MSTVHILDYIFLEVYPIHVRRTQFFDARQREGQSAIEFREELLSLIDEADGVNIAVNDLVCMMLQIELSNTSLLNDLGSVCNPTLAAFSEKIEGFEQAKRTIPSSAYGNAVSRNSSSSNHSRRNPGQNSRPAPWSNSPCGRRRRR